MKPLGSYDADERRAVGLYAVLARDVCDFLDMLGESTDETLQLLHEMLTLRTGKQPRHEVALNEHGASFVAGVLKKRGLTPRPAPVELPPYED